MNKQIIIGNLTRDPEMRAVSAESAVCAFTVAVNRTYDRDKTDFFSVSAWGKLGENCYKYLKKGSRVCVWGPTSAGSYIAGDGAARGIINLRADEVEFISSRSAESERVER